MRLNHHAAEPSCGPNPEAATFDAVRWFNVAMAFWSRRKSATRSDDWREFAAALELRESSDLAERLREHLDLGDGAIAPVFSLSRPGQPQLVIFDQSRARFGPTGSVSKL